MNLARAEPGRSTSHRPHAVAVKQPSPTTNCGNECRAFPLTHSTAENGIADEEELGIRGDNVGCQQALFADLERPPPHHNRQTHQCAGMPCLIMQLCIPLVTWWCSRTHMHKVDLDAHCSPWVLCSRGSLRVNVARAEPCLLKLPKSIRNVVSWGASWVPSTVYSTA